MTIGKTLVEQERQSIKKFIYASRLRRMLHRVTDQTHPETRQSIMILFEAPLATANLRISRATIFSASILECLEDSTSETKMTLVTKLFA